MSKKIVLLAGEWKTTAIVYNTLKKKFNIEKIIIEKPVPKIDFLKKRIKKLGWLTVGGQILFQIFIGKILSRTSQKRIKQILQQYNLDTAAIPNEEIISISSINTDECLQHLKKLQPDLIIVHGTRIISNKILQTIKCPFINIHAGITPRYRGSHGAYWALANNDKDNCGVTVHLIDAGIDTGNILFQKPIQISKKDNFVTYPYLQLAEGLILLTKTIKLLFEKSTVPVKNTLNSSLWHHPTLWFYLYKRWTKGVK